MLKTGLKKELMFFTRSFRLWGVIIAAVAFMILDPALIKLSGSLMNSLASAESASDMEQTAMIDAENPYGDLNELMEEALTPAYGIAGTAGDINNAGMLIFMLVTMFAAGGELKKRSMIIPLNAGLTPGLYVTPKFLLYPVTAGAIAFAAIMGSYLFSFVLYSEVNVEIGGLLLGALADGVFAMFMVSLYFTIGLCTAKAGLGVVIMYGGNILLTALFNAFGADKFHPFTLTVQAQEFILYGEGDMLNLWGSIGVTVLLILLCYFVTIFVISAKKVDNIGEEQVML